SHDRFLENYTKYGKDKADLAIVDLNKPIFVRNKVVTIAGTGPGEAPSGGATSSNSVSSMRNTWEALQRKCPANKISVLAGALDLLHDAVSVRDMQGRVLYLNKGFELLTGWTAHEVLGKEIQDFLQIDPTAVNAAVRMLLEKGEWRGELKMIA